MSYKTRIFKPDDIALNENAALRYLKLKKNTRLPEGFKENFKRFKLKLKSLAVPVLRYSVLNIRFKNGAADCGENIVFSEKAAARFLKGALKIIVMAATIKSGAEEYIKEQMEKNNLNEAVIIDALASVYADSILDKIKDEVKKPLLQRFSPGYPLIPIEANKSIYDYLKLEELGIYINKAYALYPEKTVIAAQGIK